MTREFNERENWFSYFWKGKQWYCSKLDTQKEVRCVVKTLSLHSLWIANVQPYD